ncbi:septal ring lytic transglycosylase RlpA family protein [Actinocatenispora rupis]|uniref:RlpA-like protein double-psi beta-barrel domain-containing protein n=1 Tax=Actinocatenispora rupis TaxID=519421 RepID=A0A8J3J052_9ACTN|nr:septal ring lytic transglycosylase RlpA family protein [Actinocatenispora rupis]GID13331.1 hypothetical protein Aru02nite_42200 [Actinocatenispora rupis]
MLPIAAGLVVAAVAAGTVSLTLAGHDAEAQSPNTKSAAATSAERQAAEQRASRGKPRSAAGGSAAGGSAAGSDAAGKADSSSDEGGQAPTTGNSGSCQVGYVATGTKTASGESFDATAMTGANLTLPFGSKVLITNPDNGKSVEIRINDRGPYSGSRCFDLTSSAYGKIASLSDSSVKVEYQVIS